MLYSAVYTVHIAYIVTGVESGPQSAACDPTTVPFF